METRWLKRKNPDTNEEEKFFPITHAKAIIYDDDDTVSFDKMYESLQDIIDKYNNMQEIVNLTLLSSNWSSSYPYTQTVSHSSIKESSSPTLIKVLTGTETEDEVKAYEKAYGLIFSGETADDSITIYAKSLPEIDFVIGLKGV